MTEDQIKEMGMVETVRYDNGKTMLISQFGKNAIETVVVGDSHHRYMSHILPDQLDLRIEAAATRWYTVYTWKNLVDNGDDIFARILEDTEGDQPVQILLGVGSNDLKYHTVQEICAMIRQMLPKIVGIFKDERYSIQLMEIPITTKVAAKSEMDINTYIRVMGTTTMQPTSPFALWRAVARMGGGQGTHFYYKRTRYTLMEALQSTKNFHFDINVYMKMYFIMLKAIRSYTVEHSEIASLSAVEHTGVLNFTIWKDVFATTLSFMRNPTVHNATEKRMMMNKSPELTNFLSTDNKATPTEIAKSRLAVPVQKPPQPNRQRHHWKELTSTSRFNQGGRGRGSGKGGRGGSFRGGYPARGRFNPAETKSVYPKVKFYM